MTKADLIERVAGRKSLPGDLTEKAVGQIIDAVFTEIGDHFIATRISPRRASVKFTYPGFGTFTKRQRNGRMVRNPATGEPIQIPPQTTLVFSPGSELRVLLNSVAVPRRKRA